MEFENFRKGFVENNCKHKTRRHIRHFNNNKNTISSLKIKKIVNTYCSKTSNNQREISIMKIIKCLTTNRSCDIICL